MNKFILRVTKLSPILLFGVYLLLPALVIAANTDTASKYAWPENVG